MTLALHYCLASTGTPPSSSCFVCRSSSLRMPVDSLDEPPSSLFYLAFAAFLRCRPPVHLRASSLVLACGHSVRISAHLLPVLSRVVAVPVDASSCYHLARSSSCSITQHSTLVLLQQSPCLSLPALPTHSLRSSAMIHAIPTRSLSTRPRRTSTTLSNRPARAQAVGRLHPPVLPPPLPREIRP